MLGPCVSMKIIIVRTKAYLVIRPNMRKSSKEAGGWGQEETIERRCALEQTVSLGIVRVSTCWFLLALCREVAMLFFLATHLCLLCNF